MTEEINELENLRERLKDLEKLIKAWLEPMATMKVNALEVGTITINDEATFSGTGLGATIAGLEKRLGEVEGKADTGIRDASTADGKAVVAQKAANAAQRDANRSIKGRIENGDLHIDQDGWSTVRVYGNFVVHGDISAHGNMKAIGEDRGYQSNGNKPYILLIKRGGSSKGRLQVLDGDGILIEEIDARKL